ncbi:MAG: MFS transporter, partial [Limnochordia bacterium]
GRFGFFVAIFGLGIGGGLALPPLDTLVTSSVGGEQRGVLTTLAGSLRSLGVALAPIFLGYFLNFGSPWPFWVMTILLLISLLLTCLYIREEEMLPRRLLPGNKG